MKNIYVEFADNTLVTFNDVKCDENGEHVGLYFEKPCEDGFCFLETVLPDLNVENKGGFSDEQVEELLAFARDNAPLIWEMAREKEKKIA